MTIEHMKSAIKEFSLGLGVDAVGFASAEDYKCSKTAPLTDFMPKVRSMVVLGYREPDGAIDSPVARISMASRLALMDLSKKNNFLIAKFIENQFDAKAAFVLVSYPLDSKKGPVGDISLRHAAVAAGLGVFGRHNLVIHPIFGTRIIFTAILTTLPLDSDSPVREDLCSRCNLCVEKCPAGALEEEGFTDVMKCLRTSQPWGIGGAIQYMERFFGASPEEKKKLIRDPLFGSLYQACFMGGQYECFKCEATCPIGQKSRRSITP